jgi:hypothetical protein
MPLQGQALPGGRWPALTRLHAAGSAAPALQRDEHFQVPQFVLAKTARRGMDSRRQLGHSVRAGSVLTSGEGSPSSVSRRADVASVV